MEQEPRQEKISHLNLDSYLEFLASLNSLDGQVIEDLDEAFFVWVSKKFPRLQNIDGFSLLDIYRKNVVNGDMEKARFFGYCQDHDFPFPSNDSEESTFIWNSFLTFMHDLDAEKREEYETWARENGIDISPGAVTKFYDAEGNVYRVRTDYDNYGEIIV